MNKDSTIKKGFRSNKYDDSSSPRIIDVDKLPKTRIIKNHQNKGIKWRKTREYLSNVLKKDQNRKKKKKNRKYISNLDYS